MNAAILLSLASVINAILWHFLAFCDFITKIKSKNKKSLKPDFPSIEDLESLSISIFSILKANS
jgi:hypothetical protein